MHFVLVIFLDILVCVCMCVCSYCLVYSHEKVLLVMLLCCCVCVRCVLSTSLRVVGCTHPFCYLYVAGGDVGEKKRK
jgi:hypothetical protein